jgi:hypothetical protein
MIELLGLERATGEVLEHERPGVVLAHRIVAQHRAHGALPELAVGAERMRSERTHGAALGVDAKLTRVVTSRGSCEDG